MYSLIAPSSRASMSGTALAAPADATAEASPTLEAIIYLAALQHCPCLHLTIHLFPSFHPSVYTRTFNMETPTSSPDTRAVNSSASQPTQADDAEP